MATILQDALREKFADQVGDIYPLTDPIADQLSLTINMLQIGRCPEASLHTILEENPDSESRALRRLWPKPLPSNLLSHPSVEVGFLMSALIALRGMGKPMRTAQLVSTETPTVRSAERMRPPLC